MQDDTKPVVPTDPAMTPAADTTTVTPAPVATEPTTMDATNVVPDAVNVELPEVPAVPVETPVTTTVPPTPIQSEPTV